MSKGIFDIFDTLRFWNDDVLNNIDKILEFINHKIAALQKTEEAPLK